jgi:hypothetical protein
MYFEGHSFRNIDLIRGRAENWKKVMRRIHGKQLGAKARITATARCGLHGLQAM